MYLNGKFINDIKIDDIEYLIKYKVRESFSLEYKKELNWKIGEKGSDSEIKEFLADISAIANTIGGIIIYGIEEEKDENGKNTGLPEKLLWIEIPNIEVLKQKIENRIREGLEPRLDGIIINNIEKEGKY